MMPRRIVVVKKYGKISKLTAMRRAQLLRSWGAEVIEERLDVSQRPYATRANDTEQNGTTSTHVENLRVKRGYRRRGVGAALVRARRGRRATLGRSGRNIFPGRLRQCRRV
ncbi:hypothetical protein ACHAW5_005902 [Stephanodiscus triporus]|uniref:N-acetyltransferase domain-containing protein n=1 Tax=Stephanodiscus triporus TaxID=2934178 RepID=A0ABD3NA43_9STRA